MGTFNVMAKVAFQVEAGSLEEASEIAERQARTIGRECGVQLRVAAASADAMQLEAWKAALAERNVVVRASTLDNGRWRWNCNGAALFESEADAVKAAAAALGILEPVGACDDMFLRGRTIKEWKTRLKEYDGTEVYQSECNHGCWGYTDCEEEDFVTEFDAVYEALATRGDRLLPHID